MTRDFCGIDLAPCSGSLALCVLILGLTGDLWSLEGIFPCEESHSAFVLPARRERNDCLGGCTLWADGDSGVTGSCDFMIRKGLVSPP